MSIIKKSPEDKKNEKKKNNQTVREVFANNGFLLKLIFTASPSFIIFIALDSIRNEVSIFFEHTIGIGYVLEAAEFGYPFRTVAKWILILAGAITIGMIFTVVAQDFIQEKERPKVRQKIKMLLYEKAKDVDLNCYDNPDFYNDQVLAISEVDKEIDRTVKFIQDTLSGITVFITAGIFFFVKDKMSIVFVFVSFVLSFIFNKMYNKLNYLVKIDSIPHSRKRDYVKRIYYLSDYAKEIRLNPGVSDVLFECFEEANDEVYKVEKKYAFRKWILYFVKRYLCNDMFSDVLFILYLVYKAAVLHEISYSSVAILYSSFGRLKRSLKVFTDTYPFACETSLYVGKIRQFLNYDPKIVSVLNISPDNIPKEIEFKNVSFSYNKKSDMLIQNINLNIKPGEKIALVGYNGAGKTTLVKLLMRLYDIENGEIKADGINIKDYNVKEYRDLIGTVFQDYHIFAGNVAENVYLDVPDNGDEQRARNALADSGLIERINRMPDNIHTELTREFHKDGVNLSGGESQKLAISRVFYKDASLMIMDEPSSALDPIAEYQLNHAMLTATKDKTVIFISHRLSTTRLADRIIMLEKGRVVEEGSHEELLKKDGAYAKMWKVQAGAYIAV